MHLAEFNALSDAEASGVVSVWAAIPVWGDAVIAGRPYASVAELSAVAERGAAAWTRADLDAALAHHPRIGERPTGHSAEATASRSEQASMASAQQEIADRIAAGNAAYEERFGRVFLIRAAGRSPQEILSELDRRLAHDDDREAAEALDQLAQIALLRLRTAVSDGIPERSPT